MQSGSIIYDLKMFHHRFVTRYIASLFIVKSFSCVIPMIISLSLLIRLSLAGLSIVLNAYVTNVQCEQPQPGPYRC